MRFEIGQKVDIVYTGKEYCAGISPRVVEKMKSKNPCTIISVSHRAENPVFCRYEIEEDNGRYYWPPDLLRPAITEIVWEV